MPILVLVAAASLAAGAAQAQDADRSVKDGGIKVDGWKGKVDRRPASQGKTIADSKFVSEGGALRLSNRAGGKLLEPRQHRLGRAIISSSQLLDWRKRSRGNRQQATGNRLLPVHRHHRVQENVGAVGHILGAGELVG